MLTAAKTIKLVRLKIAAFKSIRTAHSCPLEGVRVLDLTRIVAGPYCTQILGDLGAEVIKVERPGGGDEARKWGPPFINQTAETSYFVALNRNKKSACIDLKAPKGKQLLLKLAEKSDVLVENYVPGKLEEMGLGYHNLKQVAPRLIYCSITGFGSHGPYRNKPGYDVIAASMGGFLHITGPKGGDPCKAGVAMTDLSTGLYAHGAILAALIHRTKTGKGSNFLNSGKEASRWGTAHESIVPYEAFPVKDGYFTIGTGSDLQFQDLCKKLQRPDLGDSEKYKTNQLRVQNRIELISILRSIMVTKTKAEWTQIFDGSSFPNGPVNTIKETFEDPHIKSIGLVQEMEHPVAGTIRVVGPPVVYSDGGTSVRGAPPTLGQHTDEVLGDLLGISSEEIRELRDENVVQ